MDYRWYFPELPVGRPERNPQEVEFFTQLENTTEAIIREFIQNSLDARKGHKAKIIIKIIFKKYEEIRDFIPNELYRHAY